MKRFGIFAAMFLGLTTVALAQSQVSLGDVVRQPKPTKKATRVITNEEIPSVTEETSTPESTTSTTPAASPGATAADSKAAPTTGSAAKPAGSGKEDSPEVAAIKGRLKEVTTDELNLSSTIKDIEAHIAREEDSDRRRVLTNMLENQKRSLALRQEERANLRKKLDQAQNKQN